MKASCLVRKRAAQPGTRSGWLSLPHVAFALSLLVVAYLGFIHQQGRSLWNHDTGFWYVAGKCWLRGASPYDCPTFLDTWKSELGTEPIGGVRSFVYPPTIAVVAIPVALLPWNVATHVFRLLSFLAYLSTCLLLSRLLGKALSPSRYAGARWGYLALCGFLWPVAQTLSQGQTSLVVLWGMTAAVYGWSAGKRPWLIAGVVAACIKPQLAVLPLAYIAIRGGLQPVLLASCMAGVISLAAVVPTFSRQFLSEYADSLRIHRGLWENSPLIYDSLPSLLGSTGAAGIALNTGACAALLFAAWLAMKARRDECLPQATESIWDFCLLCVATAAMMPLHRYDMVVYVPVVSSLCLVKSRRMRFALLGLVAVHGYVWRITYAIEPSVHILYGSQSAAILSGMILVLCCYARFASNGVRVAHVPGQG